jgi:hypothetical protein
VQWRNTNDARKNSDIESGGIELARNWGILRSARKNLVDWYSHSLDAVVSFILKFWEGLLLAFKGIVGGTARF